MNVKVDIHTKDLFEAYSKQHGNAKNADARRLYNILNNTFVKERWYILIIFSILSSAYVCNDIKRKNKMFDNDERRKEEIHRAKMKNLVKEDKNE